MSSGKIIQDEAGNRYLLYDSDRGGGTIPNHVHLPRVDEAGEHILDGHGRKKVKLAKTIELLRAIREKRWQIVGYLD
jgi:hypothetical protein